MRLLPIWIHSCLDSIFADSIFRRKTYSQDLEDMSRLSLRIVVLLLILLPLFFLILQRHSGISKTVMELESKVEEDEEKIENEDLFQDKSISMDDPRLLRAIRHALVAPSTSPYGFSNPKMSMRGNNPSYGQTQAVASLLSSFGGDGFFVDCGANDGEWGSNTIWLERTLGWKGLLIEADPAVFERLISKHRNAWHGQFCLSSTTYPTIAKFYQDKYLSGLGSGLIKSDTYWATNETLVPCYPFYSVLLALNRTVVDFMSLDVEGSELDILRTLPFDRVIFKIITIEHVVLPEGKMGLRAFMEERGYVFLRTLVTANFGAGDSIFAHKSVKITETQRQRIGYEDSELTREVRNR